MNIDKKVAELFSAGCHLGHKNNRVHPKARKYIYSIENNVSVIDLAQTAVLLEKAKEAIKKLSTEGKSILVVSTKKVGSETIAKLCKEQNLPYIFLKWPAGLLTNFEMIKKNISKLTQMKKEKENGDWNRFVKHEQVKLQKKLAKLEKFYGGVEQMTQIPAALIIIDIKKEKNAFREAVMMNIPVIAVVDTNVSSSNVTYPIPGNDDSLTSIEYLAKELISSYGKTQDSKK